MKCKLHLMNELAQMPRYATDGSGCFDIFPSLPAGESRTVSAGRPQSFPTGLKVAVDEGQVMLAFSRSGHGFNNDIRLANCVGVIDSDYRGELGVKLTADDSQNSRTFTRDDAIAQALIIPVEKVEFILCTEDELGETERGEGGMGSTDVVVDTAAVDRSRGVIRLVGGVGSGKSTILELLQRAADPSRTMWIGWGSTRAGVSSAFDSVEPGSVDWVFMDEFEHLDRRHLSLDDVRALMDLYPGTRRARLVAAVTG